MAVVLALGAAVGFGLSDFVAGVSSRQRSAWSVAVACQIVAGLAIALVAIGRLGDPSIADWGWGALAGVGNAIGTGFLYRGLGSGRMSAVAPVSAVGAALLPVAVGLTLGERPSAVVWAGIVAALPGIWCVSRVVDHPVAGAGAGVATPLRDGVLAGLGFGIVFAALGRVPESAGMQPLLLDQVVALVGIVGLAMLSGEQWRPQGIAVWGGAGAGVLGSTATVLYLLSSQVGELTVVAVLTSLYPAVTILFAAVVLRERVHSWQGLGLVLCGVATVCVGTG